MKKTSPTPNRCPRLTTATCSTRKNLTTSYRTIRFWWVHPIQNPTDASPRRCWINTDVTSPPKPPQARSVPPSPVNAKSAPLLALLPAVRRTTRCCSATPESAKRQWSKAWRMPSTKAPRRSRYSTAASCRSKSARWLQARAYADSSRNG